MIWKFKIKKLLGFYRNKSSVWINVIQTDGVEYSAEVDINKIEEEISYLKPLVKSIKIC